MTDRYPSIQTSVTHTISSVGCKPAAELTRQVKHSRRCPMPHHMVLLHNAVYSVSFMMTAVQVIFRYVTNKVTNTLD